MRRLLTTAVHGPVLACFLAVSLAACSADLPNPPQLPVIPDPPAAGQALAALEHCELLRTAGNERQAELCTIRLLASSGRLGWALFRARALTEEDPHDEAWQWRFLLALRSGRFEEAEMAGSRATSVQPGGARFERYLGIVRLHTRHLEAALASLERAVALDPASGAGWYALGRAYEKARREDEALRAYRRSLELSPGQAGAIVARSRLDLRQGREDEAGQSLRELQERGQLTDQGLYLLARLDRRLGRPEAAANLAEYEQRSRRRRSGRESRIEARGQLERAIQAIGRGEPDLATVALALAVDRAGNEGPLTWSIEAAISDSRGELSQAFDLAVRAQRQRPNWWQYQLQGAIYSHLLGLQDLAQERVSAILQNHPLCLEARLFARNLAAPTGSSAEDSLDPMIENLTRYAPEPPELASDRQMIQQLLHQLSRLDGPREPPLEGEIPLD